MNGEDRPEDVTPSLFGDDEHDRTSQPDRQKKQRPETHFILRIQITLGMRLKMRFVHA